MKFAGKLCLLFIIAAPSFASNVASDVVSDVALNAAFEASRSPFTKVDFAMKPHVKVEHEGAPYFLVQVDEATTETILEKCRQKFAANCEKQFAENFSNMMQQIGLPVGQTVDLLLYIFEQHRVVPFANVTVTTAKQRAVIEDRRGK